MAKFAKYHAHGEQFTLSPMSKGTIINLKNQFSDTPLLPAGIH